MPNTTKGSSKQAACGGDHFYGMGWRGREWRSAGDVRAGSRDFLERTDAGGR